MALQTTVVVLTNPTQPTMTNATVTKTVEPEVEFSKDGWSLIFQGAESRVYRGQYQSKSAILKERFPKTYRLPELDTKLTKERIRAELKAYEKISKRCPTLAERMATVLYSDHRNIVMTELSDAQNVSHYIKHHEKSAPELVEAILRQIGQVVAQIHQCGLVHGDLTTSNFLVKPVKVRSEKLEQSNGDKQKNEKLVETTNQMQSPMVIPIDFGLSSSSMSDEDRAVDLYVLERAIQSTHPELDFAPFLESYQIQLAGDKVIKKLDQVRMRGRKRLAIG